MSFVMCVWIVKNLRMLIGPMNVGTVSMAFQIVQWRDGINILAFVSEKWQRILFVELEIHPNALMRYANPTSKHFAN